MADARAVLDQAWPLDGYAGPGSNPRGGADGAAPVRAPPRQDVLDLAELLSFDGGYLAALEAGYGCGQVVGEVRLSEEGARAMVAADVQRVEVSGSRELSSMPAELGAVSTLSKLSLHDNALSALPASLGGLTRLRALDVSGNQLATLPDELGALGGSLEWLALAGNPLGADGTLPSCLTSLVGVTFLTIGSPKVPPATYAAALAEVLAAMPRLRYLTIVGRYRGDRDDALAGIPFEAIVRHCPALEGLNLARTGVRAVPAVLGDLAHLRELNLADTPCGAAGEAVLCANAVRALRAAGEAGPFDAEQLKAAAVE